MNDLCLRWCDESTANLIVNVDDGWRRIPLHAELFETSDLINGFMNLKGAAKSPVLHIRSGNIVGLDAATSDPREAIVRYLALHYEVVKWESLSLEETAGVLIVANFMGDNNLLQVGWASKYGNFSRLPIGGHLARLMDDRGLFDKSRVYHECAPDLFMRTRYSFPHVLQLEPVAISYPCPLMKRRDSLSFDFFEEMKNFQLWRDNTKPELQWYIPPPEMDRSRLPWVNSMKDFNRRLNWATDGLLNNKDIKWTPNMFLSGSLIPLCTLQWMYGIDTRERFMEYANELYPTRDIDLYFIGRTAIQEKRTFLKNLKVRGLSFKQEELPMSWNQEQKETTTLYTVEGVGPQLKLILLPKESDMCGVAMRHHLPFVRCWYNGSILRATPTCVYSWAVRFCDTPIYFLDGASCQKKSKIVLKWAMRGFGFDRMLLDSTGVTVHPEVDKWVRPYSYRYYMPWTHPLYNPKMWSKKMASSTITHLKACDTLK
jgi:hypothetical protein